MNEHRSQFAPHEHTDADGKLRNAIQRYAKVGYCFMELPKATRMRIVRSLDMSLPPLDSDESAAIADFCRSYWWACMEEEP